MVWTAAHPKSQWHFRRTRILGSHGKGLVSLQTARALLSPTHIQGYLSFWPLTEHSPHPVLSQAMEAGTLMFPRAKADVLVEKVQNPPSVQTAGGQAGPWG